MGGGNKFKNIVNIDDFATPADRWEPFTKAPGLRWCASVHHSILFAAVWLSIFGALEQRIGRVLDHWIFFPASA
jgi:hypothetical protein